MAEILGEQKQAKNFIEKVKKTANPHCSNSFKFFNEEFFKAIKNIKPDIYYSSKSLKLLGLTNIDFNGARSGEEVISLLNNQGYFLNFFLKKRVGHNLESKIDKLREICEKEEVNNSINKLTNLMRNGKFDYKDNNQIFELKKNLKIVQSLQGYYKNFEEIKKTLSLIQNHIKINNKKSSLYNLFDVSNCIEDINLISKKVNFVFGLNFLIEDANKQLIDNVIYNNWFLIRDYATQKYRLRDLQKLDEEFLFETGKKGLKRAVDWFDINRGYKFSTFATKCIKYEICASIKEISSYKKGRNIIVQPLYITLNNGLEFPLPITDGFSVEDEVSFRELSFNLDRIISSELNKNEEMVIKLRYPFGGNNPLKLEEIGNGAYLLRPYTREGVRQIEERALSKLEIFVEKLGLKDYIIC